jgi:hypothetical protein
MQTYVRSYSLPATVAVAIQRVASRLGVSQSALVVELIGQPVSDLEHMLDQLPSSPSPDDVRRLRGESVALVKARVADAVAELEGAAQ